MATHTDNGGGNYGRKFAISRENGLSNKNGRPYFFEWLPQLPDNRERRKFETRPAPEGKERHYELFSALDGYLIGVDQEVRAFDSTRDMQQWLVLRMNDAGDEYTIECGRIDGRFSIDIMKRLLDPNFDPNHKLRISPYAIEDNGRWNIGLAAITVPDTKLKAGKDDSHLVGIAQPEIREWKGKKEYDWTPVAMWLYEAVKTKVCPRLMRDPLLVPQPEKVPMPPPSNAKAVDANFPEAEPVFDDADNLPF